MNDTALRAWPADTIERWPLHRIQPYPGNARAHSDEQITQIAASMQRWGVTAPVLVDDEGVLLYGHGRLRAAQQLGLTELPVAVAHGWSEDDKRGYRLADNQLALTSTWDLPLLTTELGLLRSQGFDMPLLGFEPEMLHELLDSNPGQADPEDAPELPKRPVSERGDLWLLGRHRLLCGDATAAKDVTRLVAGDAPILMVTDPPYGVFYDPKWRSKALRDGGKRAEGHIPNDDRVNWQAAWKLFEGDVVYVWHSDHEVRSTQSDLEQAGLVIIKQIIWAKSGLVISRGDYHVQHEPCWYAVRKGCNHNWQGARDQTTLWKVPHNAKSETGHSAQKPIECMKRPIENNSAAGEAVYDPFVGSGTTIIAAEMSGRRCLALDLDEGYTDVSVERWQLFTGKEATLDGDGRTFAEVKGERHAPRGARKPIRRKGRVAAKRDKALA